MLQRILWPMLITTILAIAACTDDGPTRPHKSLPDPDAGYVAITVGTFQMGSPEHEPGRTEAEAHHTVTLTRDFWLKTTEVTNEEYRQLAQWALENDLVKITGDPQVVLRDNDGSESILCDLSDPECEIEFDAVADSFRLRDAGHGLNPNHPVKHITWWGAAAYCDWLSQFEGREPAYDHATWTTVPYATSGYRLPTEAEWEYAARAGNHTAFAGSQIQDTACGPDSLAQQGWYCGNARGWTRPVGTLLPNAYGLYDMHGNVWEFCHDWYSASYYSASPDTNPVGPAGIFARSSRGGAWDAKARYCRAAMRGVHWLGLTSSREGLRPLLLR